MGFTESRRRVGQHHRQIDVHVHSEIDIGVTQRFGERAESNRRIGFGVTGDDHLTTPLEQRINADVVAGVAAVGHVHQTRPFIGEAEDLADGVRRPEREPLPGIAAWVRHPLSQSDVEYRGKERLSEERLVPNAGSRCSA